jgi:autotransporter-associated beta strand protein
VISGTGLIVKTGPWNNQSTWSALTLSGSNTFTGQVSVQAGNLNIDFSMVGAPTSAILPAAASIAMGKPSSGTPAVSRFGNNDGYLTVPTFKTYLNVIGSPNVVNNQT